jgi:hypothetical protein
MHLGVNDREFHLPPRNRSCLEVSDAAELLNFRATVKSPMQPLVPRGLWNIARLCIAVALAFGVPNVAIAAVKFSVFFVVVEVEVSPHQEIHRIKGHKEIVISKSGDLRAGNRKR